MSRVSHRARPLAIALLALLAAGTTAQAADSRIIQKDKAFSERSLQIRVGDTVTFVNADTVTHNVYSATPGCAFDLRTQAPGGSATVPFERACAAEVQCAIHPKMKLRVDVTR
jgi:plastocyanin